MKEAKRKERESEDIPTDENYCLDQIANLAKHGLKMIRKLFGNFTNQVYFYIYEMVNDVLLWLYLHGRIPYLQGLYFIIGLIWFQFSTIFLAHLIMGFFIVFKVMHSDSDDIFPKPKSKGKRYCLYILLFLTAPFVPCALTIRMQRFRDKREKVVAGEKVVQSEQVEPGGELVQSDQEVQSEQAAVQKDISSRTWLRAHQYDQKIETLEAAIATFHFIGATFNTIPELMMLLIFLGTQNDGEVVVIQDNEYLFWINTCTGIFSTLYALVGATNLQKQGQLDFGQKIWLLFSYFYQVLSRLSLLVGASLYTMDHTRSSSVYHLFFLLIPILIHWFLVGLIYHFKITHFNKLPLADRIVHVLSNTFVAVPLSNIDPKDDKQQNCIACDLKAEEEPSQRFMELKLILGTTGIELLLCWILAYGLGFWSRADNFQAGLWLCPLVSWALGCLFLGYYYRFKHTWCFWRRRELLENELVEEMQDAELGKFATLRIAVKKFWMFLGKALRFAQKYLPYYVKLLPPLSYYKGLIS